MENFPLNFDSLYEAMNAIPRLRAWRETLPQQIESHLFKANHGDLETWFEILNALPKLAPSVVQLNADTIQIGDAHDCDDETRQHLETQLRAFHPWRKGPYSIFGIDIETEWRSDWKWNRVLPHISPLQNRRVMDIGCGSGYHLWRMADEGASLVLGIEPYLLYVMQFLAVKTLLSGQSSAISHQSAVKKAHDSRRTTHILPLGIEAVPQGLRAFDTVFSMGVFYHRRSPFDHLLELRETLREQGELVLETLVIEGKNGEVLVPENRYAKMRNVWFLPSCLTLEAWLKRSGFVNVRCVDVSQTSVEEQHSTDWMRFESLPDFLDPNDPNLTIEGYPAPKRAIFIAETK